MAPAAAVARQRTVLSGESCASLQNTVYRSSRSATDAPRHSPSLPGVQRDTGTQAVAAAHSKGGDGCDLGPRHLLLTLRHRVSGHVAAHVDLKSCAINHDQRKPTLKIPLNFAVLALARKDEWPA